MAIFKKIYSLKCFCSSKFCLGTRNFLRKSLRVTLIYENVSMNQVIGSFTEKRRGLLDRFLLARTYVYSTTEKYVKNQSAIRLGSACIILVIDVINIYSTLIKLKPFCTNSITLVLTRLSHIHERSKLRQSLS